MCWWYGDRYLPACVVIVFVTGDACHHTFLLRCSVVVVITVCHYLLFHVIPYIQPPPYHSTLPCYPAFRYLLPPLRWCHDYHFHSLRYHYLPIIYHLLLTYIIIIVPYSTFGPLLLFYSIILLILFSYSLIDR